MLQVPVGSCLLKTISRYFYANKTWPFSLHRELVTQLVVLEDDRYTTHEGSSDWLEAVDIVLTSLGPRLSSVG